MLLTIDTVQIWRVSFEKIFFENITFEKTTFHHLGGLINFGEFYCIWLMMAGCFYGPFTIAFTFWFSGTILSGLTKPFYNNNKT